MRNQASISVAAAIAFCVAPIVTAQVPAGLENIVFGDSKRSTVEVVVNNTEFQALKAFSDLPYLLWLADDKIDGALPHQTAEAAAWLNAAAEPLGYAGFEVSFERRSTWLDHQMWVFHLQRNGLPLHDARIEVHWQDKQLLGIVNHTPGPIASVEEMVDAAADEKRVYYPIKNHDGQHDIVIAEVKRTPRPRGETMEVQVAGETIANIVSSTNQFDWIDPAMASFREYTVPNGTFPDQISVDDNGIVWFSQPNNNFVTEFDPATATFQQHPTTGGSGPDGLLVGTQGRVWTGLYFSGSLGMWDSVNQTFHNYPAPYSNARMAIPVESSDGMIWVTDHERNRISEFDPVTETFLQSLVMPTNGCWVVQGYEDRDNGDIYFTEYTANQLGRIAVGGSVIADIPVPGGGPAFCVYDDGKVYYSRWNESGIGVYDVNTAQITEYAFPVANEPGGPLWISPNGSIVIGTRNRGYIMVFDTHQQTFSAYQIPTAFPGLKDGMAVGKNGVIWFTESGVNKITRLTLMPLIPRSIKER